MTPKLLALCICPPAIMATAVVTHPPARHHAVKAVRAAVTRPLEPAVVKQSLTPAAPCPSAMSTPLAPGPWSIDPVPVPQFTQPGPAAATPWTRTPGPIGEVEAPFARSAVVPEPETWAMFIIGFGMIGASVRRKEKRDALTFDTVRANIDEVK
jgi:hypothetical protein